MDNLYASLEQRYGLPEGALSAVESVESGGKDTAESSKGAKGRFQFMPATAQAYGVDVNDPVSSAHGAAQYLSDLQKQYGSFKAALAHYNGGSKAGQAVVAGGEPPASETKGYLQKVSMKLPPIDPSQVETGHSSVTVSGYEPINPSEVEVSKPINASEVEKARPLNEKGQPMSNTELFAKGLKASGQTTITGVGQVLDPLAQYFEEKFPQVSKVGEKLGLPSAKEVAANRQQEILAQRKANEEILGTGAGLAGNVAGELGQAFLLPGGTIAKTAMTGAGMGAVQPTLESENRAFNMLGGAAAGAGGEAGVKAIGRIAQPIAKQLSPVGEKAVQILKDAGIPLDAAQATGSKVLERAKAFLSDNPITAGAQASFAGAQKAAYNKAVAKTFGEDAEHITPEVITAAKDRIGNVYDDVATRVNIGVDKEFKSALSHLNDEAMHTLDDSQHQIIQKNINDIIAKAEQNGGHLDAAQYKNLKKRLDKLSGSKDTDVAGYARDLRDLLNKGLSDSAEFYGNKADVALLKQANKEWGNMRKVEDVADFSTGEISPSKLYNSLKTKGKRYSFYAEDPQLANLAAAGKNVLPEKLPNSGTTARILNAAALPAAFGAGEALREGDIYGAGKGIAVGVVAPKLIQKALNNPAFASYLEKGIGQLTLKQLLQAPSNIGAGKVPLASFQSYLQQVQKEKGNQ